MRLDRKKFEDLAEQAVNELPGVFREKLENIAITVEDRPSEDVLAELEPPPRKGDLLGLYVGIPYNRRPSHQISGRLPDHIELYQHNIERICADEAEIREQIKQTVIHEVGHYFGLDEEDLERLGV
jgi:predicted Zn-dependent protease with MMP-like domain